MTPNREAYEYGSITFLQLHFEQDDCNLSRLSSENDILLTVSKSEMRVVRNEKLSSVVFGLKSYSEIPPSRFISESIQQGDFRVKKFKILKSTSQDIWMNIETTTTELAAKSKALGSICFRIYPTLIYQGKELWSFVCENTENAEILIKGFKSLNHTRIIDVNLNALSLDTISKQIIMRETLDTIESLLTDGEKTMLFQAYGFNYFSSVKRTKLNNIAKKVGKSKSFASQEINRGERKIMSIILSLLRDRIG